MPTYDYECKSCGYNFEVFQSIMDPPVKRCPECGKSVRRLIGGGTGIIFKGSGFYVTDSRKSSSAKSSSTKSNDSPVKASENSEKSGSSENKSPGGSGPDRSGSAKSGPGKSEKTTAAKS